MTSRKTNRESWDAFWAEASGARTELIRGVEVTVPTDIPLALEKRMEELKESETEEDFAELISLLFGVDALTQWQDNGMGLRELKVVLAWGVAHADGQDLTFAEAFELVQKEEAAAGKPAGPPNRAARRAASNGRSASTGGRSKQTSSASTGSARKRSRA